MKDDRGLSIVEILVGMGIAAIVAMAALTLILNSNKDYEATVNKLEARKIISGSAETLTRMFSSAQNIISVPAVSGNIPSPTIPGQMRLGSWNTVSATANNWVTIANFRRDSGANAYNASARRTDYKPTGIFYVLPTATTSGVLFVDLGTTTPMSPSYSDLFFDRITELEIDQPKTVRVNGADYLKGFHVKITVRLFMDGNKNRWRWCPKAQLATVAACSNIAPFKDYIGEFNVIIPNQALRMPTDNFSNITVPERTLGPGYLFPLHN